MAAVKSYTFLPHDPDGAVMRETCDGEWVRYKDYAALKGCLSELEQKIESKMDSWAELEIKLREDSFFVCNKRNRRTGRKLSRLAMYASEDFEALYARARTLTGNEQSV